MVEPGGRASLGVAVQRLQSREAGHAGFARDDGHIAVIAPGQHPHRRFGLRIGHCHEQVDRRLQEAPSLRRGLSAGQAGHHRVDAAARARRPTLDGTSQQAVRLLGFDHDEARAAIACSRSALTYACSTITQRQPRLCAAAASARPWLPSVALTTTKALQRVGVATRGPPPFGQCSRSSSNTRRLLWHRLRHYLRPKRGVGRQHAVEPDLMQPRPCSAALVCTRSLAKAGRVM